MESIRSLPYSANGLKNLPPSTSLRRQAHPPGARSEPMTTVLPDQIDWLRLTTRVAAGDEAAFLCFYEHFFDRLFRYVLVMTHGDEQLSRDLLQKLMLK